MSSRIKCIDYLKTIAVIGVVLYHIGIFKNGYLGVEVFFVISGFLFVKANKSSIEEKKFNPIRYLLKKISDFWPLIVISGLICLVVGYFNMLPDDYENLAQSIVASNVFANNVLQAITTRNYWDVVNTYKALMHTWYIGVLFQSLVFLALTLWASRKIFKNDFTKSILIILTVISFVLYLLPFVSAGDRFYFFHFRLFEIALGGLIVYFPELKINQKTSQLLGNLFLLVILSAIFADFDIPEKINLIIVTIATIGVIYAHSNIDEDYGINQKVYSAITIPGRFSYDIYIWHQIVIAFLYYFAFQKVNVFLVLLVIVITSISSFVSFFVRKQCSLFNGVKKRLLLSFFFMMISSGIALFIYMNAGVVRDVPELGIDVNNVHRHMHAEYVDIPNSWDNDFEEEDKIHILVMGNSFGRDFANILSESSLSRYIEISYSSLDDASDELDRIEQADYIFYGANSWNVSNWVLNHISKEKLYIVGNKRFGNSNGIYYINRDKEWYFSQRAALSEDFLLRNNAFKGIYGDHYIDMITPLLNENGISVFTDDNYYISQDCRHLTKFGAEYYARILDLGFIVVEYNSIVSTE